MIQKMRDLIGLDTTVVATRSHVAAEVADEVVILHLERGEYFGLNEVGARIWDCIQEPCTIGAIRDRLLEEYPDVERERCTRDAIALIRQLVEATLADLLSSASDDPDSRRNGTSSEPPSGSNSGPE